MERNSNENFEQFLRQNAEEFRMHPSPKVWDNISDNLTKRKRRFYFGLVSLLISSSILGYTLLDLSFDKLPRAVDLTAKPSAIDDKTAISEKIFHPADNTTVAQASKEQIKKGAHQILSESLALPRMVKQEVASEEIFGDLMATQRQSWMVGLFKNQYKNSVGDLAGGKNLFDFTNLSSPTENIIKPRRKAGKFETMFFFTPTVSYRNLSENKSYLRSPSLVGIPYNYAALYDVNNMVTHKPNIGLELGVTSKYAITKNIKLRGGLQFNINRYDIKAFKYSPERPTIVLNSGSSGVQSVSATSTYRNLNGGETDWIQNFYFQVSTPIGAEVKLHGSKEMYIGMASTLQPTYVLGDRAYLITADYKNYAQVPWLIRRWNMNTNLETFVAYSTGKLKWQVGPQVRYQLLSSFVSKYPVKENLFDFGLKVGISVNQNQ